MAVISYLPQRDWHTHPALAQQLQEQYRSQGRRAAFFPVGASDEIGLWGYVAACAELREDFIRLGWQPDLIVTATGSGGTQSGLIAGTALLDMPSRVAAFAVCDDAAWFEAKVRQDLALWQQRYAIPLEVADLPVLTLDEYVGPGYGKAGPEVFATIAELARTEGLFLDPVYTGKAFHGMVAELEKAASGRPSPLAGVRDVLFIHTGGLFGLFPQRHQFEFP